MIHVWESVLEKLSMLGYHNLLEKPSVWPIMCKKHIIKVVLGISFGDMSVTLGDIKIIVFSSKLN